MELDKIRFRGFDVNSSSLQIKQHSQGGRYSIKYSDYSVTYEKNERENLLFIAVNPKVTGFNEAGDHEQQPVFIVEISLTLSFECGFNESLSQQQYAKYAWFFDNFVSIATKLSVENVLKNSILDTLDLPWSSEI